MTAVSTAGTAPRPRSPRARLRARLVLAGLSACGLAALAWASFVHPLPRLTYNPSDSVAVGWYRVDPLDLTLTPPSNTSRRKARSTRRPARHRKQPCIYAGVGLSRAGGWPAAA